MSDLGLKLTNFINDSAILADVVRDLAVNLSSNLKCNLFIFKRHIIKGHAVSCSFYTIDSQLGAPSILIEGLISIRLIPRLDIIANLILFSQNQRLVIPDDIEKTYIILKYDLTKDQWENIGWFDDEFGEFENIKSPRYDLYEKLDFTEE